MQFLLTTNWHIADLDKIRRSIYSYVAFLEPNHSLSSSRRAIYQLVFEGSLDQNQNKLIVGFIPLLLS
ncbi:hypothetical protein CIPAW_16G069200 [Carya illinoinensis]|uniref:Uncharacterized protein n=1 Tax=Carya illinoinensis TaxID=32201 RepID=A0A8T1N2A4_CARIL|nr:hypothetical protein CIPAW_16G069200 [Carya illinoinensis]